MADGTTILRRLVPDGSDETRATRGANQARVRAHNERLVLSALRRQPHSRAELTRHSGLSAQTITQIVRALSNDGLIEAGEPVRGRVGQPSVPLSLAPAGAWFGGLSIGRRAVELVLIDFLGNIVERQVQAYRWPDPDEVLAFVAEHWPAMTANLPSGRLHGLGIAQPYLLWEWSSKVGATAAALSRWRDRDLMQELAERFDTAVWLENDATAACGAELTFGRSTDALDLAYLYVGHIVGGGLVSGGAVQHGAHGNAGAFGPLPVSDPTRPGRVTALMDVASLHVLESLHGSPAPSFRDEHSDGWSADPATLHRWTAMAASALADAAISIACIVDVEAVVIDGPFPATVRRDLTIGVRTALAERDDRGLRVPAIVPGSLGSRAPVLGAARLPMFARFLLDRTVLTDIDIA